jgi:hypothetical protein
MILSLSIWPVIKILVIILLAIYIVFAFVIVRQVQLMTDTLVIGFEKQLKFLAFLHFLFAIAVLVFSILIL